MGQVACCSLVFFTLSCYVQCQLVQFVRESDLDFRNLSSKGLLTSESDWNSLYRDQQFHPAVSVPRALTLSRSWLLSTNQSSHNGRRIRRQAYYSKNTNTIGGAFSWKNKFTVTIPPIYSDSKESAYARQENVKRFTNVLEKGTGFQFLNPTGLRISVPADNINIRIVDFRFKLNEDFRGNDGGHYAPPNQKRGGLWVYEIPELRVKQGDKIYYMMYVKFNKDGTDITAKGVLEITLGNPHGGGAFNEQIPFRPTTSPVITTSPVLASPYGGDFTPNFGGSLGDCTIRAVWNHEFNISATNVGFTQNSANSWIQLLRNSIKNICFQFLNPSGLTVLIPGNNDNVRIEDFRLKLNEEFWDNDGGHYAPQGYKSGSSWTYNIPQLKIKQGDNIYYWMQVKLGREGFNTMVRGVLEIRQGDPHQASNTIRNPSLPVFSRPHTPVAPPKNNGQGGGQWGQQTTRWEYNFTINRTYNTDSTQVSTDRWLEEVQLFKNTLDKDIKFQFFNPTGMSVLIPGNNEDVKILAFNVKLNEEFSTLEPGQYVPNISRTRDGWLNYYFPNLKLRQGDKAYFWMHVALGKQAFDNIVKGVLHVTQGDPHIGRPAPMFTVPAPLIPIQPPPSNSQTQYPPPSPPNNQPSQTSSHRYPPASPPNKQPFQTSSQQYPPASPPNKQPSQTSFNQYPPASPPNKQPSQTSSSQYPPPPPSKKQPSETSSIQYPTPSTSGQYPTGTDPLQPDPNQYSPLTNHNKYPSESNQPCIPSQSTRNGEGPTLCQGDLMFEHKFNTMKGWTHQVTIGGKYPEDDFTCYTRYNENAWVRQGKLHIKPTLLADKTNDSFVRFGELNLEGCTSRVQQQCHRQAQSYSIIPPINSARINTQKLFTFRYGTVEIRAKLPQGDWIVPELWLEPTNPNMEEKVVMALTRGNSGNTGRLLGAGVDRTSDKKQSLVNIMGPRPWFQGFHVFRMDWTPDNVRFSVDNQQIHSLPTNSFAVLSQEVYFSLGVHVGGSRDFPDDMFPNRPWSNMDVKRIAKFWDSKENWYRTWRNDPTLQVEYIRVTAL